MSLGLGQILGMGLLSQFMGGGKGLLNDKEPQQPTQTASNNTNQGFGGVGGIVSGVSNQLFQGMSQEQVARLGIGFNSMRLEPDANLAKSFQSTIDTSAKAKNLNGTVQALIKMGKPNLAGFVESGAMDGTEAMKLAIKDIDQVNDSKGVMAMLQSKVAQYPAFNDLITYLKVAPEKATEISALAMKEMGVGVTDFTISSSPIQVDQETGQQYKIVTDPNKPVGKRIFRVDVDGAKGLTDKEKEEMRVGVEDKATDVRRARDYSAKAFEEGRGAVLSIEKYNQALDLLIDRHTGELNADTVTGWFQNQLMPNMTAEQAQLGSIANMMGIDVINMATFGALSEREMAMAMATNLDRDLTGDQLVRQIKMQIEARTKLANELFGVASDLNRLGSHSEWQVGYMEDQKLGFDSRFNALPKDIANDIQQSFSGMVDEFGRPIDGAGLWFGKNINERMQFLALYDDMTENKFYKILGKTNTTQNAWKKYRGN